MKKQFYSLCLFICIFQLSFSSFAQNTFKLGVCPLGSNPILLAESEKVKKSLASSLKPTQLLSWSFVSPSDIQKYISTAKGTSQPSISFEELESKYQAIKEREKTEIEPTKSISEFEKMKAQLKGSFAQDKAFDLYQAVLLQLSKKYFSAKKVNEAKLQFEEMIRLDSSKDENAFSNKREYRPDFVQAYQNVYARMAEKARGDVSIQTPSKWPATITIDGQPAGQAPASVSQLHPGEHYIKATFKKGGVSFKSIFIVEGENTLDFSPPTQEAQDSPCATVGSFAEISDDRAHFMDQMGVELGTDILVFLSPLEGKVSGQLFDQRTQTLSSISTAASANDLSKQLILQLDKDGYVLSPTDTTPTKTLAEEMVEQPREVISEKPSKSANADLPDLPQNPGFFSRMIHSPWFYVILGTVAASAAGGYLYYYTDVFKTSAKKNTLILNVP